MANDLSHERHRWGYMTERQLATRLRRITDPIKLGNFIELACEREAWGLLVAARSRAGAIASTWCFARADNYLAQREVQLNTPVSEVSMTSQPEAWNALQRSATKPAERKEKVKKPTVRMIRIGRRK